MSNLFLFFRYRLRIEMQIKSETTNITPLWLIAGDANATIQIHLAKRRALIPH
jgi:hypothetical protein